MENSRTRLVPLSLTRVRFFRVETPCHANKSVSCGLKSGQNTAKKGDETFPEEIFSVERKFEMDKSRKFEKFEK